MNRRDPTRTRVEVIPHDLGVESGNPSKSFNDVNPHDLHGDVLIQYLFTELICDLADDDLEGVLDVPTKPTKRIGSGRNATSEFLDKRLRDSHGSFMATLRNAVAKKLPVSHAVGIVDDHIQNCFMRLIARDSLRDRLTAGYKVTDQQIALFAVRAGFTDIRDSGTDPVCREMYGARTEREREKGVVFAPIHDARVVWATEGDEHPGTWMDIADNSENQEDAVAFAQVCGRLEDTIRKYKPTVADRYIGILRSKATGGTINSIADGEGVSSCRASAMMAEVRRVLRKEGIANLMA
jgi:hypothetical protein